MANKTARLRPVGRESLAPRPWEVFGISFCREPSFFLRLLLLAKRVVHETNTLGAAPCRARVGWGRGGGLSGAMRRRHAHSSGPMCTYKITIDGAVRRLPMQLGLTVWCAGDASAFRHLLVAPFSLVIASKFRTDGSAMSRLVMFWLVALSLSECHYPVRPLHTQEAQKVLPSYAAASFHRLVIVFPSSHFPELETLEPKPFKIAWRRHIRTES